MKIRVNPILWLGLLLVLFGGGLLFHPTQALTPISENIYASRTRAVQWFSTSLELVYRSRVYYALDLANHDAISIRFKVSSINSSDKAQPILLFIEDPNGTVVYSSDYVERHACKFEVTETGCYRIYFQNDLASSPTEKHVECELSVVRSELELVEKHTAYWVVPNYRTAFAFFVAGGLCFLLSPLYKSNVLLLRLDRGGVESEN